MMHTVAKEFGGGTSGEAFDRFAFGIEHIDAHCAGRTGGEVEIQLLPVGNNWFGEHFAFLATGAEPGKAIGAKRLEREVTRVGSVVATDVESECS